VNSRNKNSLSRLKTFESFRTPAYRIYYGSMAANWFAMNMLQVVRFLLIFRLSGSAAVTGGLALANAIPTLLVCLIGGTLGDRMQKKYILLIGRVGLALLALSIALLLSAGYLSPEHPGSWWLLIISAVFEGGINGLIYPTTMSIIPEIVGRERLMNAIFLSSTGQNMCRLFGPALAGFLVDAYGFSADYYFMTGLYIIGACFTIFLPRTSISATHKDGVIGDTLQGLRHLGRDTAMLLIVLFAVCHVVSGQPFNQLLPVFTDSVLKVNASKLGLLISVSGIGAGLGSLILASLTIRRRGLLLLLSGIMMGMPVIIFTYFHQWYICLFMMPFIGLGQTMHGGFSSVLVQTYAEPNYRARMQSFLMVASSLSGFGTFLAGVLAENIGIQTSIGGFAIFLTLISIVFILFATRLRKMD
jgi:MFS family permease